jgi:hypothetical protein
MSAIAPKPMTAVAELEFFLYLAIDEAPSATIFSNCLKFVQRKHHICMMLA